MVECDVLGCGREASPGYGVAFQNRCKRHSPKKPPEFLVSWSVNGCDVSTVYEADHLFGPSLEDESVAWFEWLLRSLDADRFVRLTIEPVK